MYEEKYELRKKEHLKEMNADGYILKHKKTGANIVFVKNEDKNRVFTIGFRTPPNDDTGLPHILEHSVLCGSDKYPLKDPFVELVKGSLNTFLNAMTYSDKTVYPIASYNEKDFHNMMDVYLDAVFFPNIYKEPNIFLQEGWHYELEGEDGEPTYNGVVYNEMKGVFSSPEEQLMRMIQKSLLKDTCYQYESGGDPEYITSLTREDFLSFHKKYYHPSNSYIYFYGDLDLERELAYLDEQYLSRFDYRAIDSTISLQAPYKEPVRMEEYYSITEGEEESDEKVFFSYNTVIDTSLNRNLYVAFQVLDYVLLSMPGAPIKKALVDAGIGQDVFSSYDNGILQPTFSIIAKNAKKEQEAQFISIIEKTLKDIIDNGIGERVLRAAFNRLEFKYKEANFGRYPKGLVYGLQMFDSWLYEEQSPFYHVVTEDTFAFLKSQITTGYFEQLVEQYLYKNTHKSIVVVLPKAGLTAKIDEATRQKLAAYKDSLSKEQVREMVEQTKALKRYQDTPSSKEDLEKIPLLTIADIDKKVDPFDNHKIMMHGIPVIHHSYFTNGIVYLRFSFDMKKIPLLYLPYVVMLSVMYKEVDTKSYGYRDLTSEINLRTGGLGFDTLVLPSQRDAQAYVSFFEAKAKCLDNQVGEVFALASEIMWNSNLDDEKRLKELITELKIQLQSKAQTSGHAVSANRALSYVDTCSAYKEHLEGVDLYEWLVEMDKNFDSNKENIIKNMKLVRSLIFTKENLTISMTSSETPQKEMEQLVAQFAKELQTKKEQNTAKIEQKGQQDKATMPIPTKKNEAFVTSGKVQYVGLAGSFVDGGFSYTGALRVLQVIFSYEYLWKNVRVKGGAYGAMCGFGKNGSAYFTSYRDPNLMETYEIYKNAPQFVANFEVDERDMTKYIIGAISNMDVPLEPEGKGNRSYTAYLVGATYEDAQKERDELLGANKEAIRALAPLIQCIVQSGAICTVGSERKIEQAKEEFLAVRHIF